MEPGLSFQDFIVKESPAPLSPWTILHIHQVKFSAMHPEHAHHLLLEILLHTVIATKMEIGVLKWVFVNPQEVVERKLNSLLNGQLELLVKNLLEVVKPDGGAPLTENAMKMEHGHSLQEFTVREFLVMLSLKITSPFHSVLLFAISLELVHLHTFLSQLLPFVIVTKMEIGVLFQGVAPFFEIVQQSLLGLPAGL